MYSLKDKRDALIEVKKLLAPFGEYIAVVPGASVTRTTGPGVIKDLRKMLVKKEKSLGGNPEHDWSKKSFLIPGEDRQQSYEAGNDETAMPNQHEFQPGQLARIADVIRNINALKEQATTDQENQALNGLLSVTTMAAILAIIAQRVK